ncbi:MAG: hypothetical protein PHN49_04985, partial [Candidatus Omnitrophica bacterium]|nr:hypothetical protein [Candidatus Omnitrophota bacterium]
MNKKSNQKIFYIFKKSITAFAILTFFMNQCVPLGYSVDLLPGEKEVEENRPTVSLNGSIPESPDVVTPEVQSSQNFLGEQLTLEAPEAPLPEDVRDLPEYSFEDALDYLTPDYAAAVIVTSLTAENLKTLTEQSIETGLAVIGGKVVLFTSGNREEVLVNSAARELLKSASLIAHVHPQDTDPMPSLSDYAEAGTELEYVISKDGIYAYNQDGLENPIAYQYNHLAEVIDDLKDDRVDPKQTRDLLNAFIKAMDDYNFNLDDRVLFRSSGTVLPNPALTHSNVTTLPV